MQGGKRLMETVNCQLALFFFFASTWKEDFLSESQQHFLHDDDDTPKSCVFGYKSDTPPHAAP